MAIIPFGEYLPDLPALGNPGATVAKNVIPHLAGYKPLSSLVTFSGALTARCQGAFSAIDTAGVTNVYAGDATSLYRLTDVTWTDASQSGAYTISSDQAWNFVRWNNDVLAANVTDPVQKITMGGTTFGDLFASTLKPKARHMAVVRDFLVLGNVEESSTFYPARVRWSAKNDPADMDQSADTQAGKQDLLGTSRGGGWIQAIVGREYGIVFQEHSIWRMTYVGEPDIFTFDEVETNRGAYTPGGVIDYGRMVFYLAEDGFYLFDGITSIPIGKNKVDLTFFAELDASNKHRITGCVDPVNSVVMWAYPTGNSAGGGDPDKIIMFNWTTNSWSFAEVDTQLIFCSTTTGYTLEGLDTINASIDALSFSLDSRVWTGGETQLSAFDRTNKLAHFTGSAMAAVLETAESQMTRGQRSFLTGVRPLIDAPTGTITAQIATRDVQNAAHAFGSAITLNANGICPVRSDARYHRFRFNITGGFTDAIGFDIDDGDVTAAGNQ